MVLILVLLQQYKKTVYFFLFYIYKRVDLSYLCNYEIDKRMTIGGTRNKSISNLLPQPEFNTLMQRLIFLLYLHALSSSLGKQNLAERRNRNSASQWLQGTISTSNTL